MHRSNSTPICKTWFFRKTLSTLYAPLLLDDTVYAQSVWFCKRNLRFYLTSVLLENMIVKQFYTAIDYYETLHPLQLLGLTVPLWKALFSFYLVDAIKCVATLLEYVFFLWKYPYFHITYFLGVCTVYPFFADSRSSNKLPKWFLKLLDILQCTFRLFPRNKENWYLNPQLYNHFKTT